MRTTILLLFIFLVGCLHSQSYWNSNTRLTPWRMSIATSVSYEDLTGDGTPDIIRGYIFDSIPFMWIDDDGDMKYGDIEGDTDNDCLLIDLNRDGLFAGPEDLSIDWIDTNDDGVADMQLVIYNGKQSHRYNYDYTSDYICVIDRDDEGILSFIDWNQILPLCWEHIGHANFLQDYHGNTLLLKMHASSFRVADLRYNCENPFIFMDEDNDKLSEVAIRMMDVGHVRKQNGKDSLFEKVDKEYDIIPSKNITWVSLAWDMDNDNGQGNEFDLDMTLHFAGKGFNYENEKHTFKNMKGLTQANKYLYDSRWREMKELIFPDEKVSYTKTFGEGQWNYCWFVFDEDDDCNRWERVELYYPYDEFKIGAANGGLDAHKQSDSVGDRGEFDEDNSGKGQLYISPIDGRIHLYGAEWGVWRIDQNAKCFQGFGGLYPPASPEKRLYEEPEKWATVKYTDADGNGFFDSVAYDLDGDMQYEEFISLIQLGIDDSAPLHHPANMKYADYTNLFAASAANIEARALEIEKVAQLYNLNTKWYSFWKHPRTLFEKYSHSYWLNFYIYKDLLFLGQSNSQTNLVKLLHQAYYSGDYSHILKTENK